MPMQNDQKEIFNGHSRTRFARVLLVGIFQENILRHLKPHLLLHDSQEWQGRGPKKSVVEWCGPVKRVRLTLATDTMSLTDDLASCHVLHSSIPWIRTWTLIITILTL